MTLGKRRNHIPAPRDYRESSRNPKFASSRSACERNEHNTIESLKNQFAARIVEHLPWNCVDESGF